MEGIMTDNLMKYFDINGFFTDRQYGFIKGRSTVIQMLNIMDMCTEHLESGGRRNIYWLQKKFSTKSHIIG